MNVREFRGKERRDDKVGSPSLSLSLSLSLRSCTRDRAPFRSLVPSFVLGRSVGRRGRGLPGRRHLACWRVPPRRRLWGGWVGGGVGMGPVQRCAPPQKNKGGLRGLQPDLRMLSFKQL